MRPVLVPVVYPTYIAGVTNAQRFATGSPKISRYEYNRYFPPWFHKALNRLRSKRLTVTGFLDATGQYRSKVGEI